MFDINVHVIVSSLDIDENDRIRIVMLSTDKSYFKLPYCKLEISDLSVEDCAKRCFENYFSIKYDWIEGKLLDITKTDSNINVYFVCSVPKETPTSGFFFPINQELLDPIIQKAIRYS